MRARLKKLSLAVAVLSPLALSAVLAPTSYADSGSICTGNTGTIKMSPGLLPVAPEGANAQVQNITIKGVLTGCTGSTVTEAPYVAHLKTDGPVDCSVLTTGETASGTIVVKWKPKGQGNSHGTVNMVLTEGSTTIFGKLESGPLEGLGLYGPSHTAFGACGTKKLKKGTLGGSDFRVAARPKATIESPADGGVYPLGAIVPTSFSCAESTFGPGLESCTDSNGASGGSGMLDTSTPGLHTYSVTAVSIDRMHDKATIEYEVQEGI